MQEDTENIKLRAQIHKRIQWMLSLIVLNLILFAVWVYIPPKVEIKKEVLSEPMLAKGSIDPDSQLIVDNGYLQVKQQCQSCHSLALVTQNYFSREVWLEKIRWMQAEQNLGDLGESEKPILDYLARYYNIGQKPGGKSNSGRRKNLETEWYNLD